MTVSTEPTLFNGAPATQAPPAQPRVKKTALIRDAFTLLGTQESRPVIEHIRAKHGVEVTTADVANARKSLAPKRDVAAAKPSNPRLVACEGEPTPAPSADTCVDTVRLVQQAAIAAGGIAAVRVILNELEQKAKELLAIA